ncbi:hypothetical protein [Actinopolymorpha alba]|uniref:hypothetical protein n=1 Tax=Actinopolymorpha alba TaxID=533267 RepID=UPI0003743048|nr:hypothetical protein [Actinopolymorpha alba]
MNVNVNIEEVLRRELRDVAEGLRVPTRPTLPQAPPRALRYWQPLLAAAAVMLIVAGAVAVAAWYRDGETFQPAPQPTKSRTAHALTTNAPTVPYLLDGRFYVAGERLPGSWQTVEHAGGAWVAQRDDDTWWWGTSAEPHAVPGGVPLHTRLSPDGRLLAVTSTQAGGQVRLLDTRTGETLGTLRIDLSGPRDTSGLGLVAVTDNAQVFLAGDTQRSMWLGPDSQETVDLTVTAPNQWVQASTAAGLVVIDANKDGQPDAMYLAQVSNSGEFTRLRALPGEDVVVNPSGTWLARGGSWGGEAPTDPSIQAQPIDGGQPVRLTSPDDRDLLAWAWETDDLLIAKLISDGSDTGLARCSVQQARCVLIDAP